MYVNVSKADVYWSYFALIISITSGVITLPLVLHFLSTDEIAMNYLMMTIGSMVALIDFGFAPQFGRNISYVFSGSQKLQKEGLCKSVGESVNYHLLKCLIEVAKKVYLYMSVLILILMLSLGSLYIYIVTGGFSQVENSLIIWLLYSLSVFFNIYFYYYSSLLTGRGLIKEGKKASLFSKIVYIAISYTLLFLGFGLMGLCIANLISPFVGRWMSFRYFYDSDILNKLGKEVSTIQEERELFRVIWYNAKKLGITFIGGYAVMKFSLFVAGLFLTLEEISSYGLMMQLVGIIASVSTIFFTTILPRLTSIRITKDMNVFIKESALAVNIFYVTYALMSMGLLLFGPPLLEIIVSNAHLPSLYVTIFYLIVVFLENNHSVFGGIITTGNSVPYWKTGLVTGIFVCIGDVVILNSTSLGLLGLVAVQGICQLAYQNWYWPKFACRELSISYYKFSLIGIKESYSLFKKKILNK